MPVFLSSSRPTRTPESKWAYPSASRRLYWIKAPPPPPAWPTAQLDMPSDSLRSSGSTTDLSEADAYSDGHSLRSPSS